MEGTAPPAPAAQAPTSTAPAADGAAGAPAVTPDWVPGDFAADYGTDAFAEKLARAYADKSAKLSTRQDDLRKQIEAERRQGLPEKPDGYKVKEAFSEGALRSLLEQNGITLVDEFPSPEQMDPKAYYYKFSDDSPTIGWWREFAHKSGLSQDQFAEGIAQLVVRDQRREVEAGKQRMESAQQRLAEEVSKLGADGKARQDAAEKAIRAKLVSLMGDEKGKAAGEELAAACLFASGVEGVEAILKAMDGSLQPGGDSVTNARPADLMFPHLARK